ncbi:hypothetical protein [Undibacterium sp. RuTC16W]|uniref:hypothetical protein n=1 Tax=Undibacterium sp. RuTC16W TaxID=3413048 RepID=UPI003BF20AD9
MTTELSILVGTVTGALAAYITAKVTTNTQLNIARGNADKDITLQRDRLKHDHFTNELSVERAKLDALHRILSRIELENSQTMSYIQSVSNLGVEDFRSRYLENCERLHEAMAIADIHYPEMSEKVCEIYGQSNIFWGNQENLLRTDIKANEFGWQTLLSKVLEASQAISTRARHLKFEIAHRAKELSGNIAIP